LAYTIINNGTVTNKKIIRSGSGFLEIIKLKYWSNGVADFAIVAFGYDG